MHFEAAGSMRYCFYVKPDAPPPRAEQGAVSLG
jgi:hypothetical protein